MPDPGRPPAFDFRPHLPYGDDTLRYLHGRPFGCLQIVSSLHWPMVEDGTEQARSKGHPLVYWLSRQLARFGIELEPDVLWQVPRMRPADMKYIPSKGLILCHPAQEAAIKQALQDANASFKPWNGQRPAS